MSSSTSTQINHPQASITAYILPLKKEKALATIALSRLLEFFLMELELWCDHICWYLPPRSPRQKSMGVRLGLLEGQQSLEMKSLVFSSSHLMHLLET